MGVRIPPHPPDLSGWRNGRRAWLRTMCLQRRGGSNPLPDTRFARLVGIGRHARFRSESRKRGGGSNPSSGTKFAPVGELADPQGREPCSRKGVEVRVFSGAPVWRRGRVVYRTPLLREYTRKRVS